MSENSAATFVGLCLAGRADPEEIDEFVDRWHEGDMAVALHEFLGMAWDEYALWVANPDRLPDILAAHREGRPLSDILRGTTAHNAP